MFRRLTAAVSLSGVALAAVLSTAYPTDWLEVRGAAAAAATGAALLWFIDKKISR